MGLHDPRFPDGVEQLGHFFHALVEDLHALGLYLLALHFHERGNIPAWDLKLKKNSYFHDRIFCEVLRGGDVPAFMEMKREQVEAKRMEVFNERMKKMPELFEAIRKTRVIHDHQVEIVPIQTR